MVVIVLLDGMSTESVGTVLFRVEILILPYFTGRSHDCLCQMSNIAYRLMVTA